LDGAHHGLESLEVGDGGRVASSDELVTVLSETSLDNGDDLAPVVIDPGLAHFFGDGLSTEHGLVVAFKLNHHILAEIHDGVNFPAGMGVLRVVTETDAEHAKNGAALGVHLTIFLPDGHLAKG